MATKTISLQQEAYDRLRSARRYTSESFSEVILRVAWPCETVTGAGLLSRYQEHGSFLVSEDLDRIEQAKIADRPPEDK
jgi:hypothetical protein